MARKRLIFCQIVPNADLNPKPRQGCLDSKGGSVDDNKKYYDYNYIKLLESGSYLFPMAELSSFLLFILKV